MQGKYWMLSGHLGGYSPAPGSKADNLCIPIDWFENELDINQGIEDDHISLKTNICVHFYWKVKLWWIQIFCLKQDRTSKMVRVKNLWRYPCLKREENESCLLCSEPQFDIIVVTIDSLIFVYSVIMTWLFEKTLMYLHVQITASHMNIRSTSQ